MTQACSHCSHFGIKERPKHRSAVTLADSYIHSSDGLGKIIGRIPWVTRQSLLLSTFPFLHSGVFLCTGLPSVGGGWYRHFCSHHSWNCAELPLKPRRPAQYWGSPKGHGQSCMTVTGYSRPKATLVSRWWILSRLSPSHQGSHSLPAYGESVNAIPEQQLAIKSFRNLSFCFILLWLNQYSSCKAKFSVLFLLLTPSWRGWGGVPQGFP